MSPLPCCPEATALHVRDLAHVSQFDFDLYRCPQCQRHWVRAWRAGTGGWETVTEEDAATMRDIDEASIREFIKKWAVDF